MKAARHVVALLLGLLCAVAALSIVVHFLHRGDRQEVPPAAPGSGLAAGTAGKRPELASGLVREADPSDSASALRKKPGGAPGAESSGSPAESREAKIARLIRQIREGETTDKIMAARELCELEPKALEAIPALVEALRDPDKYTRFYSAECLEFFAPDAREAIPALVRLLKDEIPSLQFLSAKALRKMGFATKEVLPALLDAIRKERWSYRKNAISYLGEIGEEAKEAIPVLAELLEDDEWLAEHIVPALGKMGQEGYEKILEASRRDSSNLRKHAARALAKGIDRHPEALPAILEALGREDSRDTRERIAADLFKEIGKDPATLKAILDVLASGKDDLGEGVVESFDDSSPLAAAAIRVLGLLSEGKRGIRSRALWALQVLEKQGSGAVPALGDFLRKEMHTPLRWQALVALHCVDPEGRNSSPILAELLNDPDPGIRTSAIGWLSLAEGVAAEISPALVPFMQDGNAVMRFHAASVLCRSDPALADSAMKVMMESVPGITSSFTPSNPCTTAFVRIGLPAVPGLIEALSLDSRDARGAVARDALFDMGDIAVPGLLQALKNGNPGIRVAAAELLAKRRPKEAAQCLPCFREALGDPDLSVRFSAARNLARLDPGFGDAADVYAGVLKEGDPELQCRAAGAIGGLGPKGARAIPELLALLEREEPGTSEAEGESGEHMPDPLRVFEQRRYGRREVRICAAEALSMLGPEAVPGLVELLKHRNPVIRGLAADSLGKIGPAHSASASALSAAARSDPDSGVRSAAMGALSRSGGAGIDALAEILRTGNEDARSSAAWALTRNPAKGAELLLPILAQILEGETTPELRLGCLEGMTSIARDRDITVRTLVDLLRDPDEQVRRFVMSHIPDRPGGAPGLPRLRNLLKSPDTADRMAAAEVLYRFGPPAAGAVPDLIPLLRDEDPELRSAVARALGAMGTAAAPAIPDLQAALKDPDKFVRLEAARALRRAEGRIIPR